MMYSDITPKITVVTCCKNAEPYLQEGIESVLNQEYPNLEYIVIDGKSSDNSLHIISQYNSKIAWWESNEDPGFYYALEKGFLKSSGDLMCWLNADDVLLPGSLKAVGEIFSRFQQVQWLQGWPTVVNSYGLQVATRPPVYNRQFFMDGNYRNGSFIQQESCFWRRSLWQQAGSHINTQYKLAADFELWMRFFRHAELFTTTAQLGAFRIHGAAQLSIANREAYLAECNAIIMREKELQAENATGKKRSVFKQLFQPGKDEAATAIGGQLVYNVWTAAFELETSKD